MSRSIGGVVLCGGRSRRMGRPKATLPFGPETMLARVVRLVSSVASPVVVVAAPDQEVPPLTVPVTVVRDEVADRGPLQGLAAGLAALPSSTTFAYATATDVPFLHPDFILYLESVILNLELAIPFVDGFHHTLAAVYRREAALPAIEGLLAAGRLRPFFLTESLRTRVVTADELRTVDPTLGTLRNLNTPDDYRASLREAGFEEGQGGVRVKIELFGVPRLRAGAGEMIVEGRTIGEALAALARACPALEGILTPDGRLHPAYTLNRNAERFVTDPETPLEEGDSLLLLAVDVGG